MMSIDQLKREHRNIPFFYKKTHSVLSVKFALCKMEDLRLFIKDEYRDEYNKQINYLHDILIKQIMYD